MKNEEGVTLGELLVVVIIIGILAMVALVQYQKTISISRVREAQTALRLIQAAQKMYRDRYGSFTVANTPNEFETRLGIDIEEGYWDYKALDPGASSGTVGRADQVNGSTGLKIDDTGEACCDSSPCYHVSGC
jgi:type II secretory pathway pseudopilin PulG